MTDSARVGDAAAAIAALPRGCGVVLRDYRRADRGAWARRLIALCRRQRRLVLVAGEPRAALAWGADGVHLPRWRVRPVRRPKKPWLITAAAHDRRALTAAKRAGADAVMLSPVFATASHAGAPALGPIRFRLLARAARCLVIALGGIDVCGARRLPGVRLASLAAIGSLLADRPSPAESLA